MFNLIGMEKTNLLEIAILLISKTPLPDASRGSFLQFLSLPYLFFKCKFNDYCKVLVYSYTEHVTKK